MFFVYNICSSCPTVHCKKWNYSPSRVKAGCELWQCYSTPGTKSSTRESWLSERNERKLQMEDVEAAHSVSGQYLWPRLIAALWSSACWVSKRQSDEQRADNNTTTQQLASVNEAQPAKGCLTMMSSSLSSLFVLVWCLGATHTPPPLEQRVLQLQLMQLCNNCLA